MRRHVPVWFALFVGSAAAGCGETPSERPTDASTLQSALPNAVAATTPGGPASGETFGLGRSASADVIAPWDTDIGPDGASLPTGRGSVAEGNQLYQAQCASCHGVNGAGMPGFPALVGRDSASEGFRFAEDLARVHTIGNYWSHATTLFDYIRRAMPHLSPGALTDSEVYALTAYLLARNEIIPMTDTLDAERLRAVRMPYADRFVNDTRPSSTARPSAR